MRKPYKVFFTLNGMIGVTATSEDEAALLVEKMERKEIIAYAEEHGFSAYAEEEEE